MSLEKPVDRAALHRLQKTWLEIANATRYTPGIRPSIIDMELPPERRKGEIVQVCARQPPLRMGAVTL